MGVVESREYLYLCSNGEYLTWTSWFTRGVVSGGGQSLVQSQLPGPRDGAVPANHALNAFLARNIDQIIY
jgi:hypothetical protein